MLKVPKNEKSVMLYIYSVRLLYDLPRAMLGVMRGDIDIGDLFLDDTEVRSGELSARE